jgi:histone-lysine N-methyltransferase SETMAR
MDLSARDFRLLILYDFRSNLTATQSHQRITAAFPGDHPSYSTVRYWFERFSHGQLNIDDCERTGRPTTAATAENIASVKQLVEDNPRITYEMIAGILGIGNSAIYSILHNSLGLQKLESKFVPHHLTAEQKACRMKISQQLLDMFHSGSSNHTYDIITGDETILRQFQPHHKRQSAVWCYENELPEPQVSANEWGPRIMVCVFFSKSGHVATIPVMEHHTVTAEWYTKYALSAVLQAWDSKRQSRRDLRLHHDNAAAHTAKLTREYLAEKGVTVLPHPPYSPDLSPPDFFLFGYLKQRMRGKRFKSLDEVLLVLGQEIAEIGKETWHSAFNEWFRRLELCVNNHGDYVCL